MRLLAVTLVPLFLLGGLELGLRALGYGFSTSYFQKSTIGGEHFLVPNYKFSRRFFPPALARVPVLCRMAEPKPEGTFRIFLFGESAAFGDPEPSFGVGRFLEVLLEERYPDTDFEVICVAMTAINSHAILPIARECARRDGDLWVIYMGNNEMVGPYGAGTVFGSKAPRLGVVRTILALKATRVGQLLDALVGEVAGTASGPQTWGGIGMFRNNQLRSDDVRRLRAYDNFKGNLDGILRAGAKAQVPVLLSTVASNLRDCAPFASLHAAGLVATDLSAWDKLYQDGMAWEFAGSYADALNAYSNAAAIDAEFAELQFRIGNCHLALTNRAAAREAYERARDYDALAVRADSRINEIILAAAGRHADTRVVAVDAAQALAGGSPEGIPGQELFYEHVHFTLAGNYQLARVFADHVAQVLPASIASRASAGWADAEVCHRRLAVTIWDENRLWREELQRMSIPPFTDRSSHPNNVRYCQDQLQEAIARIKPETPAQDRQMYEAAVAAAPEDNLLRGNFAQFLEATGSRSEAIRQAQRVCELLPELAWPYQYLGALLMREGRTTEATEAIERASRLGANSRGWPDSSGPSVRSDRL
jgi:tetratricopeptide (TPR) repeat protein